MKMPSGTRVRCHVVLEPEVIMAARNRAAIDGFASLSAWLNVKLRRELIKRPRTEKRT